VLAVLCPPTLIQVKPESAGELSRARTLDHPRLEFPGLIPMARRMRRLGS
jgi:hypothetical protein